MILEGIVTSLDLTGSLNIAPMGPRVGPDLELQRFVLKPFRSSTTFRNLKARGEGVFHVTDDVLLLARSTIGKVRDAPTRPAEAISGQILLESCRYYEFRVIEIDDREERARLTVETCRRETLRDFFGFNRARHAVLEAAIIASRIEFLPMTRVTDDLETHRIVVEKTGGPREAEAFTLLENHIRAVMQRRSVDVGTQAR